MNVSIGNKLEEYVADLVKGGSYNNASEVVRDALRIHEEYQLKLAALKKEVNLGIDDLRAGRISRATPEDIINSV